MWVVSIEVAVKYNVYTAIIFSGHSSCQRNIIKYMIEIVDSHKSEFLYLGEICCCLLCLIFIDDKFFSKINSYILLLI